MNIEDRMAMNVGRLLIQVEQGRAMIDEYEAKLKELAIEIESLRAQLRDRPKGDDPGASVPVNPQPKEPTNGQSVHHQPATA